MSRPKYTLNKDDLPAVSRYLTHKLLQADWLTEDNAQADKAVRAFQKAMCNHVTLNAWCEKWLNNAQWQQLKAALRAARKRLNDRTGANDPKVSVTLERRAWLILRRLAQEEGLTLSGFIEKRHTKEWLKLEK
jgi:macrodomain Ter protein organizer (MatP/YcbG family)